MKEKGFTLIELLAVIVVLAIIALIATPIILNIIEDSKNSSNKRSIELYAKAVENAVGRYQVNNPQEKVITFTQIKDYIEYEGNKVECDSTEIYEDGTIYLDKCKIDNKDVKYTYGKKKAIQVYKPQYYWYETTIGNIGDSLPSNATTMPPAGYMVYVGFDVEGDKISKGYVCFVRNETEYCLNGNDTEAYNTNVEIMKDAYSDVVDTACKIDGTGFFCYASSIHTGAIPDGYVVVRGASSDCGVLDVGSFWCDES